MVAISNAEIRSPAIEAYHIHIERREVNYEKIYKYFDGIYDGP